MKRIGLIGVVACVGLLTTGCGNKVELTCSMTEDESYASMTAEVHLVYEDDELTTMELGALIEVDDEYAEYLSYFEDSFKEEFEDASDYVKVNYKTSGNSFTATARYDITKMTQDDLDSDMDYEEEYASYETAKEHLEEEGYTCK